MFKIHDHLFVGLAGLGTDVQTLYNRFKFRHNLYKLREDRDMKPSTFANLVSAMLYEKRCALVAGGGPPRPRARRGRGWRGDGDPLGAGGGGRARSMRSAL